MLQRLFTFPLAISPLRTNKLTAKQELSTKKQLNLKLDLNVNRTDNNFNKYLPQALFLTSQNVSTVSFLVVKMRKSRRIVSLCESVLFLLREQLSSAFSTEVINSLNVARSNVLI